MMTQRKTENRSKDRKGCEVLFAVGKMVLSMACSENV